MEKKLFYGLQFLLEIIFGMLFLFSLNPETIAFKLESDYFTWLIDVQGIGAISSEVQAVLLFLSPFFMLFVFLLCCAMRDHPTPSVLPQV